MNVTARAWLGLIGLAAVMALLLFGCAGTVQYAQAWVFLGIFFSASLLITLYLMKNDPSLLERRVRGGPWAEPRGVERVIMSFASLAFIATLVVPAFDHRLHWSSLPLAFVIAGDVLVAVSFIVIFFVYRENTYTAATIEVVPEQHVVETGPYALVRHPMYAGATLLFIGAPLALGSAWGLLAFLVALPVLVWRLFDEESLLTRTLPGYASYRERVRWRMIPGVF